MPYTTPPSTASNDTRRDSTSFRLTFAQIKRWISELDDSLRLPDDDQQTQLRTWELFVQICEHPSARAGLAATHVRKIARMLMYHADTLPGIEEKLEYMDEQTKSAGWPSLELYIRNAHIPRSRGTMTKDAAIRFLDDMRANGLDPNGDTFSLLMDALGSRGDGDAAGHIMQLAHHAGMPITGDMFQHILLGFARGGRPDDALQWFREMERHGAEATARHYSTVMSAFAKAWRRDDLLLIYKEMTERGVRPTIVTFNIMLGLHCSLGDMDAATSVFALIDQEGLEPQVDTYNTLITALVRLKRQEDAVAAFEKMQESGIQPSKHTYAIMIHSCGQAGMMINAMRYYRALLASGLKINHYHYTVLMAAFAAAKDMETSVAVFKDMMEARYAPTARNFNVLISGWMRQGDVKKAEAVLDKMKVAGVEPTRTTWRRMIRGYLAAGQLDEALAGFAKLRQMPDGPTIGVYVHLINACWDKELQKVGLGLLDDFQITIGAAELMPYAILERIAVSYLKANELTVGMQWVGKLRLAGHQPRSYLHGQMIRAAAHSPTPQLAFELYEAMVAQPLVPTTYVFNHLLTACRARPDLVEQVLADMTSKEAKLDHYTYGILIRLRSKANRFPDAWSLWIDYIGRANTAPEEPPFSARQMQACTVVRVHPAPAYAILMSCAFHGKSDEFTTVLETMREFGLEVNTQAAARAMQMASMHPYWIRAKIGTALGLNIDTEEVAT
ncbi:hypothetical protein HKX48_005605 [Thoreauomyces humboldtii]|nr:hypothetical protein HKX48_005605 [Thoreauomyces humboldtii]